MAFRIDKSITQDDWIGQDRLAVDAVGTVEIENLAVTNPKLADLAVDTAKISGSAVTTAKIADSNVTLAKMAANSVDTLQLVDGSVETSKIVDSNVTESKLAADSVSKLKLNSDVVTGEDGLAYNETLGLHISAGMIKDSMLENGDSYQGVGFVKEDGSVAITATQDIKDLNITSGTGSSSTSTGAVIVSGGAGISENLNVGGTFDVAGAIDGQSSLNIDGVATISGATHIGSSLTVDGNTSVNGNLYVAGVTTTVNSTDLLVADSLITINEGEGGSGVSSITAGIEIDRGTFDNYMFIFDDATDNFKVGEFDNLQPVATREDDTDMQDGGIALWNSTNIRLETDSNFTFDGTNFVINSTQGVSSIDTTIDGSSTDTDLATALAVKSYVDTEIASATAAGLQNVVEDLDPALGGDLFLNSSAIGNEQISGSAGTHDVELVGGMKLSHRTVTATDTVHNFNDHIIHCSPASSMTLTLPTGSAGKTVKVTCSSAVSDSITVKLEPKTGETILGENPSVGLVLDNPYSAVTLISNGSDWAVL